MDLSDPGDSLPERNRTGDFRAHSVTTSALSPWTEMLPPVCPDRVLTYYQYQYQAAVDGENESSMTLFVIPVLEAIQIPCSVDLIFKGCSVLPKTGNLQHSGASRCDPLLAIFMEVASSHLIDAALDRASACDPYLSDRFYNGEPSPWFQHAKNCQIIRRSMSGPLRCLSRLKTSPVSAKVEAIGAGKL